MYHHLASKSSSWPAFSIHNINCSLQIGASHSFISSSHNLVEALGPQICYADIKPANLLLRDPYPAANNENGSSSAYQESPPDIRVIDFGCAQHVLEGTKLAKRTGTVVLSLQSSVHLRDYRFQYLYTAGMGLHILRQHNQYTSEVGCRYPTP